MVSARSMQRALYQAIRCAGSQTALAQRVGVRPQAVHLWVKKGRVPAARALAVERATAGQVSRHELRPDLYPNEAAPSEVCSGGAQP
ncbi:MAG: helix-turn-helix domain-containing protein [Rhodocyclaceae bacterium]|nr:helix-turn-helix domain-containing protein [Rhodocyclaceae bacterium]